VTSPQILFLFLFIPILIGIVVATWLFVKASARTGGCLSILTDILLGIVVGGISGGIFGAILYGFRTLFRLLTK
jgi:hypothetical protein